MPELSEKVRIANAPDLRFRQFTRLETQFGAKKGTKVMFDRVKRVEAAANTTPTAEDADLPKSKFTVSQGYVQVNEHGLTIPYTGLLEHVSEVGIEDVTVQALQVHQKETIDLLAAAPFKATPVKYIPLAADAFRIKTDGVLTPVTDAAARAITAADAKRIVNWMKKQYIPPYEGGNWICIGSVDALQAILDDPKFVEIARYANPEGLYAGELGTFNHCRFVEAVHGLSDVLGTTAFAGECVFFGADPVVEGVSLPEEIRHDPPRNIGRFLEMGWYGILGYANTWDTNIGKGEQRVMHVTSA
jgi:N4-gp56 family major capsid protein